DVGGCMDGAAQYLGLAPGLRYAAARRQGRFGVEDFADRTDACLCDHGCEAGEKAARLLALVGMHLEPGIDERSDQPGPDRALVISGVARAQIAKIAGLEIGLVRRERTH